jgi:hypothetical protein
MKWLMVHVSVAQTFAFYAIMAIAQPAMMASRFSIALVFSAPNGVYVTILVIAFPASMGTS